MHLQYRQGEEGQTHGLILSVPNGLAFLGADAVRLVPGIDGVALADFFGIGQGPDADLLRQGAQGLQVNGSFLWLNRCIDGKNGDGPALR